MLSFFRSAPPVPARQPVPSLPPALLGADIAARYHQARVGGDFYDFVLVGRRLIFTLLDIAGDRVGAMLVAASVQDVLRERAAQLFAAATVNEADAITALALEMNRELLRASDGVRCTPGFLGCYHQDLASLTFINAGNAPALLKDSSGTSELGSTGLPMGLFTHTTHDAGTRVLEPGAIVLAASRGVIEAGNGRGEFGSERLRETLARAAGAADEVSSSVIEAVKSFVSHSHPGVLERFTNHHHTNDPLTRVENDMTVMALVRLK